MIPALKKKHKIIILVIATTILLIETLHVYLELNTAIVSDKVKYSSRYNRLTITTTLDVEKIRVFLNIGNKTTIILMYPEDISNPPDNLIKQVYLVRNGNTVFFIIVFRVNITSVYEESPPLYENKTLYVWLGVGVEEV